MPEEPTVRSAHLVSVDDLEKQVDAILDKVRLQGIETLTEAERHALDQHANRLRQRDHAR